MWEAPSVMGAPQTEALVNTHLRLIRLLADWVSDVLEKFVFLWNPNSLQQLSF